MLRVHIIPTLGSTKVRQLSKGYVKTFLAEKLKSGLSRNTVRIHATVRGLMNSAIDDGVIIANPASQLGRQLRLVAPPTQRQKRFEQ
jgi:hypothetical protein